ncbi:MAG: aspartate/glutamate racemase family protein [Formosimonas sp.]
MNTIGLLGGMSWESTVLYYQTINRAVREANPSGDGLSSAPILLDSIDFAPMAKWQREGNWDAAGEFLAQRARMLEAAGAQILDLCTNTMHKVFAPIAASVSIPMLHIATPSIAALQAMNATRVAFLGTQFSMQERFLADIYAAQGIELLMPDELAAAQVHHVIMNELCQGQIHDASRQTYLRIIEQLQQRGAQAVVLGCTEITLLLRPQDCALPLLDTADLHARALARLCLGDHHAD